MEKNLPVYQFLGYKLIESHFFRNTEEKLKKFSVQVVKSEYNDKEKIYNIIILIKLQFGDCNESSFVFLSGYKINDDEWLKEMDENSLKSILFSGVFPFLREKINGLCDDSRGGLMLPIIDLRGINLNNEVVFTAN